MVSKREIRDGARHIMLDLRQMKSFCEHPLIIDHASGIYLYDIDGRRIIDGISGIFVVNVGHGNERVIESVRRQQDRVSFVAPIHAASDTRIEYAIRLGAVTPGDMNTFKFFSGGSESTEAAIKLSRQYHRQTGGTGKYKIVSNYRSYHGATLGAMSASGIGGTRKSVFGPFLEGFVHVKPPLSHLWIDDPGVDEASRRSAQILEETILAEGPESVAAFIVEPIGNTGGILTPSDEYFRLVREICTRHNVLLIFDEVITGMGRTGDWFGAQTFGCLPDIMCMGKGLSGGYAPLAGIAIRDELYFETFWGDEDRNIHFASGHTFGGNPVSTAAGIAVIDEIQDRDLLANGQKIGDHLRTRLETEVARLGILREVRGRGCLAGVEFAQDPHKGIPFPAERRFGKRVERRLLDAGLILRCDPDWIAIGPPLTTAIDEADEILDILMTCLRDELAAGNAAS